MLKFIAERVNKDEHIVAIMTCSDKTDFGDNKTFKERLVKAITQWITNNEEGKKVYEENNFDFNFGDLSLCSDNAELKNIMAINGIFDLTIEIAEHESTPFDYDEKLVDDNR